MDCNISKYTVFSCKTVLESFSEEKVNVDIVIPDYFLAAGKILKCEVIPTVNSKNISENKLTIEGVCKVNLIYLDDNVGSIRSICEYTTFTQSFTLSEQLTSYKTKIKLRAANITCKLQNSRRVSVKCTVGIAIKVMGNIVYDAIDQIEDCNIETLYDDFKNYTFIDSGETDTRIVGEFETKDNINDIINSNANVYITESKAINEKILVKGKAEITVIYTSGEDVRDFESINGEIPFSEVIDVSGVNEMSICDIDVLVNNIRCDVSGESENDLINIELDVKLMACAYNNTEIRLLKDAYSREHNLHITKKEVAIESMCEQLLFTDVLGETIKIDLPDARIIDVVPKPIIKSISSNDDLLVIEGDMYLTIYAQNGDEYRIIDNSYPFDVSREIKYTHENMRCEATLFVKECNFSMPDGDSVAIKPTIDFSVFLFVKKTYDTIDSLKIDYENYLDNLAGKVFLYYADKGEKLWDIAKKYYSSVDIIKRDNEISDDVITDSRMILIARN